VTRGGSAPIHRASGRGRGPKGEAGAGRPLRRGARNAIKIGVFRGSAKKNAKLQKSTCGYLVLYVKAPSPAALRRYGAPRRRTERKAAELLEGPEAEVVDRKSEVGTGGRAVR
jgi:hypothetical protein